MNSVRTAHYIPDDYGANGCEIWLTKKCVVVQSLNLAWHVGLHANNHKQGLQMEYAHGKRMTPLHHEAENEFETRLELFKKKARNHYSKKPPANETPAEKKARLEQEKADFAHLKQEALHLETLGFIHARLETYQKNNRAKPGETMQEARAREKRLKNESHHPTDELESNMRAMGRAKPSSNHTAHHVVPGRGWTENANKARVRMHLYGVGINDGDNGAWMLKAARLKPHHWFNELANSHKEIHTYNYEMWLWFKLQKTNNEIEVRQELRGISGMIEEGSQPKEVRFRPKDEWPEDA